MATGFYSCSFQEKDIFDAPAAERLEQSIKDNLANFQSASNGWVMQYFAYPETAGFPLIIKFGTDNFATVMGRNSETGNVDLTKTGMYSVKTNEGTVLSFDTYNPVIHAFSDPDKNPLGYGYEGDFEFTIMSHTADMVRLKGKKRGINIYMNRLPEGQSWSSYFDAVYAFDAQTFKGAPNKLILIDGSKQIQVSGASGHILTVGEDMYGFVVKPNGIHLEKPIAGLSADALDFELSADKSKLVSTVSPNIYFTGDNIYNAFVSSQVSNAQWAIVLDDSQMGSTLQSLIATVRASLAATGRTLNQILFKIDAVNSAKPFAVGIMITGGAIGHYHYDVTNTANSVTYVSKGTCDNNGTVIKNNFAGTMDLINAFEATYTLASASDNGLSYKKIKVTSNSDSNFWFYIQKYN